MLAHIHSSKIDELMRDIIKEHLHKDPSNKTVVNLARAEKTRQFWVERDLRKERKPFVSPKSRRAKNETYTQI